MIEGPGSAEFLNRTSELAKLKEAVASSAKQAALVIIRSPAGYGKSSLTTRLSSELDALGYRHAIADPQIRAKSGDRRLHDGYFIQRVANTLNVSAGDQLGLGAFLKQRRWKTARGKKVLDTLRTLPSPQSGYATAVDYVERLLAFGRYSPAALLTSDQAEAVSICREYVKAVCEQKRTVLIVRETQHIDTESLRGLLQFNGEPDGPPLVLEYTTDDGHFQNDHHKLFEQCFDSRESIYILDLVRLERWHFEQMLSRYAPHKLVVSGDFYATWDGDLRRLKDLRFQVGIGQQINNAVELTQGLVSGGLALQHHIDQLSAAQRFALACIAAHKEQIAYLTLVTILTAADPSLGQERAGRAVKGLIGQNGLLSQSGDWIAFADKDVSIAASEAPGQAALIPLAERLLRDHYLQCFVERDFSDSSAGLALRQAFRLLALTGDNTRLLSLFRDFEGVIRTANDPGRYLDILLAVLHDGDLLVSERRRLEDYAANLAYDIVDFDTAANVLSAVAEPTAYQQALLAQSHVETGRLADATRYAIEIRSSSNPDEVLHGELIEAGIALVENRWEDCRRLARAAIDRHRSDRSPLLGHAFRLLESTQDYPDCTETALDCVRWYEGTGGSLALAYAELAAARHLARNGQLERARALLQSGASKLDGQVRDQHLLWNAKGAIGLLDADPAFDVCAEMFRKALLTVRDDFSELVVRTNLAIARWKSGDISGALGQVTPAISILQAPRFSDRHVFWPACYNLAQVLRAAGQQDQATAVISIATGLDRFDELNPDQWAYRYGRTQKPDTRSPYLQRFDNYPLFLSHWQVDREAVARLSGAPTQ